MTDHPCPHIAGRTHTERDGQRRWPWQADRRVVCGGVEAGRVWPHSCADPDPAYRRAMSEAGAARREEAT